MLRSVCAAREHRHRIARNVVAHRNTASRRGIVVDTAILSAAHKRLAIGSGKCAERAAPQPTGVPCPILIIELNTEQIMLSTVTLLQFHRGANIEMTVQPHRCKDIDFALRKLVKPHTEVGVMLKVNTSHQTPVSLNDRGGINNLFRCRVNQQKFHAHSICRFAPCVNHHATNHAIHRIGQSGPNWFCSALRHLQHMVIPCRITHRHAYHSSLIGNGADGLTIGTCAVVRSALKTETGGNHTRKIHAFRIFKNVAGAVGDCHLIGGVGIAQRTHYNIGLWSHATILPHPCASGYAQAVRAVAVIR